MAKKVERSLDRDGIGLDLEQLVDRFELLVDLSRRLGLDVDHNPAGDVVDDDRSVANVGDRAEVLDDPAGGRLVVVGGDDEKPVYAELVRFARQVDGVSGGVGAGAGDNGAAPAQSVDGDPEELEPLVVAEVGALPRRSGHDEPVGTTLDEVLREFAEALEVDGTVAPERRDDGG